MRVSFGAVVLRRVITSNLVHRPGQPRGKAYLCVALCSPKGVAPIFRQHFERTWSGSGGETAVGADAGARRLPHISGASRTRHFGAFVAFGFPTRSQFASAGWTGPGVRRLFRAGDVEAAAAIVEPWQEAVGAAAGPIVSYLIIIACTLAVRRFGPGPLSLIFALGFVTPWRWTWPFPILFLILRGARVSWGPDEMIVSALTGIPQSLVIVLALVSLVLGYWFIVTALPRGRRVHTVVPTLVGGVLGGVLWILALGPLLLP